MPKEIERKFIVDDIRFLLEEAHSGEKIIQGYLAADDNKSVRIRIKGASAWITIKSGGEFIRDEYQYSIPIEDAHSMMDLCEGEIICKTRYNILCKGKYWALDIFKSPIKIALAEVELNDEDEEIELPIWACKEVTGDPKYYNKNIAMA